jgi:hypothetical protein
MGWQIIERNLYLIPEIFEEGPNFALLRCPKDPRDRPVIASTTVHIDRITLSDRMSTR